MAITKISQIIKYCRGHERCDDCKLCLEGECAVCTYRGQTPKYPFEFDGADKSMLAGDIQWAHDVVGLLKEIKI